MVLHKYTVNATLHLQSRRDTKASSYVDWATSNIDVDLWETYVFSVRLSTLVRPEATLEHVGTPWKYMASLFYKFMARLGHIRVPFVTSKTCAARA